MTPSRSESLRLETWFAPTLRLLNALPSRHTRQYSVNGSTSNVGSTGGPCSSWHNQINLGWRGVGAPVSSCRASDANLHSGARNGIHSTPLRAHTLGFASSVLLKCQPMSFARRYGFERLPHHRDARERT